MSAGGLSQARLERMQAVMTGYVERGEVPGVVTLVGRRGEVHIAAAGKKSVNGGDPIGHDTIFRISSMTKPIIAAATMVLVEECKLRLDEAVDRLLPELADRKVLKRLDGPLDDTVPANRPITVRDLLTFRLGFGMVMAPPDMFPIQKAMNGLSLGQSGPSSSTTPEPDEWIRRLGTLPLLHQPGEKWMYNTGCDVLGVLIARASGQTLESFLRERLFAPLGMKDTGFSVAADKIHRLATSYEINPETGVNEVYDAAAGGQYSRPPAFPSGAGGLVSTVDDYLAFHQMMLNSGKYGTERILSRLSVEAMTTDQLTTEQKEGAGIILGGSRGWGFGMSIITRRDDVAAVPGRFGWDGGLGTSAYVDPREELIGILMTQQAWTSPTGPNVYNDFWTSVYASIDD
ncbi:MAG: beta-lactamase family protein [Akkermansiaceae bacterium]|nr:beta-lactamase family protein [Armatimonadota bacterium]